MSGTQVLLVAGTHGNEINAPWLLEQWTITPELIKSYGVKFSKVIGNPEALQEGKRYLDQDLNRSFIPDLLTSQSLNGYELLRAKELLSVYGSEGCNQCQIAIDLHSTTSRMGSSLVIYGRRAADLALASLIQAHIGIPVYLHEGDPDQKGFLVEAWPCGLVIEIGPAPQGLLLGRIVQQTRLLIEICFELIGRVQSGHCSFPDHLVVHRHLVSIDFPRDSNNKVEACLHPDLQGRDWQPIFKGDALFLKASEELVRFEGENNSVPVFINEAAYAEKFIAMSLTKREIWPLAKEWVNVLEDLIRS